MFQPMPICDDVKIEFLHKKSTGVRRVVIYMFCDLMTPSVGKGKDVPHVVQHVFRGEQHARDPEKRD